MTFKHRETLRNRTTLFQVGSALIDHWEVTLRNSTCLDSHLRTLASAINGIVRFTSGAFVINPTNSVMTEAGTLLFKLLSLQSTAWTVIQIMSKFPNISTHFSRRISEQLVELTGSWYRVIVCGVHESLRLYEMWREVLEPVTHRKKFVLSYNNYARRPVLRKWSFYRQNFHNINN